MTVNSSLACPACCRIDIIKLEFVDVARQHMLYAPSSPERQSQLNEVLYPTVTTYQMLECQNCQLEFANPAIAPNSNWYDIAYKTLDLYPQNRWEFDFVIENFQTKGKLLELGCGSGEFLKICKNNSISAIGLDFSEEAVKQCHSAGLDVQLLNLDEKLEKVINNVKTITAFHVLEHLPDPIKIFELAGEVSTEDTILLVAVPSCFRPSRILKMSDFLDQPPHHMTRWNKKSLKEIGLRTNWLLSKIYFEPISIKASCWWVTRNMWLYKFLHPFYSKKPKVDQILRIFLFPFAFVSRNIFYRRMKGFTMLASFRFSNK
jgi:SAM-dependent methyltransferase